MSTSLTDRLARYGQLRTFESDFDRAQLEMRRTAALWVLAAFSALAYLLMAIARVSSEGESVGIDVAAGPFLGVTVCWLAILGLFVLWYVDQRVYQRMLNSVFVYGLCVEWCDSRLPQVRTQMYFSSLNISINLSRYYSVAMAFFSLISLVLLAVDHLVSGTSPWLGVNPDIREFLLVLMSFMNLVLGAYTFISPYKERDLLSVYGHLYPRDFVTETTLRLARAAGSAEAGSPGVKGA